MICRLLLLMWLFLVRLSVVLWLIEVWMIGRLRVMFMVVLKFLYLSMGRFWLWYIVSIVL